MPQVTRTEQAKEDLIEILLHLERQRPSAAERFHALFTKKCELLIQFPYLGEARDDLQPGVRCVSVDSYVLFYEPKDDGIEITRVLHGSRNFPDYFDT